MDSRWVFLAFVLMAILRQATSAPAWMNNNDHELPNQQLLGPVQQPFGTLLQLLKPLNPFLDVLQTLTVPLQQLFGPVPQPIGPFQQQLGLPQQPLGPLSNYQANELQEMQSKNWRLQENQGEDKQMLENPSDAHSTDDLLKDEALYDQQVQEEYLHHRQLQDESLASEKIYDKKLQEKFQVESIESKEIVDETLQNKQLRDQNIEEEQVNYEDLNGYIQEKLGNIEEKQVNDQELQDENFPFERMNKHGQIKKFLKNGKRQDGKQLQEHLLSKRMNKEFQNQLRDRDISQLLPETPSKEELREYELHRAQLQKDEVLKQLQSTSVGANPNQQSLSSSQSNLGENQNSAASISDVTGSGQSQDSLLNEESIQDNQYQYNIQRLDLTPPGQPVRLEHIYDVDLLTVKENNKLDDLLGILGEFKPLEKQLFLDNKEYEKKSYYNSDKEQLEQKAKIDKDEIGLNAIRNKLDQFAQSITYPLHRAVDGIFSTKVEGFYINPLHRVKISIQSLVDVMKKWHQNEQEVDDSVDRGLTSLFGRLAKERMNLRFELKQAIERLFWIIRDTRHDNI